MRFAIKTRPEHTTWEQMRDIWVAADDIELFESAWNWDHFYPLSGDLTGPNFEAWTMLAALAQATRRIRLGCQVTGMVYRHPAVLANMAATVDIISGGRLELGLGAGWNQMECDAYGIDLPPLRERFDRFDEGVEAIVSLLSQTTTTFAGQYVKLTDARCEPKPVQRPHPPLWQGVNAPDAAANAAHRGVNIVSTAPSTAVKAVVERYYETRASLAHGGTALVGMQRHVYVGDTDAEALKVARPAYKRWYDSLTHLWRKFNTVPMRFAESLDRALEMGTAIVGAPGTVRAEVERQLSESGCRYFVGRFIYGDLTYEQAARSLALFGQEVMPRFGSRPA
jgi:alkanesulfonate monooxygenase SsuD/methylene tetrahydromethanopterin reductase-like flavin-dependent oxidoreductase (luciferase family)